MKITNPKKFREEIREFVLEKNVSLMDALLHHCELHNLEVETVAKLIDLKFKEELANEAKALNMLKEE